MYEKVAHLVSIVLGSSIDPCIMLYSDYRNKSGAVSVIVGRVERTFLNEDKVKVVDQFLSQQHVIYYQLYSRESVFYQNY